MLAAIQTGKFSLRQRSGQRENGADSSICSGAARAPSHHEGLLSLRAACAVILREVCSADPRKKECCHINGDTSKIIRCRFFLKKAT